MLPSDVLDECHECSFDTRTRNLRGVCVKLVHLLLKEAIDTTVMTGRSCQGIGSFAQPHRKLQQCDIAGRLLKASTMVVVIILKWKIPHEFRVSLEYGGQV